MKRLVNVRFPVIVACALIAGIFLGYVFKLYNSDLIWVAAAVPLPAVIAIIVTLVKKRLKPLILIAVATLVFICGTVGCFARISAFSKRDIEIVDGQVFKIYGTVCDKFESESYDYIIVKNVTANGEKLTGKVRVYLTDSYGEFCDVGYSVEFFAELKSYETFEYGKLNYAVQKNVKYSCSVYGGLKSRYRFSLFGYVRSSIRKALFENLDGDTAAICYAMLTGDTQAVENDAIKSFRQGGVAHIFAVSGLHIGIVYGILQFFCKRLKLNKFLSAAICIGAVAFYCGVCGFTVSSLRAAIMCTVASISKLSYQKNDSLNSLAVAVVIIMTISPLSLFTAGFQLSVCAAGGIIVFSKGFERSFNKIKIPNKISSGVGVAFGAQVGTLPVMLANFGYISGAGLILNVIIIPVLSALFAFLFVCTGISLIISAAAPLLISCAAAPLEAVISFLFVAGFEKTLISGFGAGMFIPLYFIGALAFSDKLNLKFLYRTIAIICSVAVLCAFVSIKTYLPYASYKICVSAYNGGGDIIIKSPQGDVLIVCNGANRSEILNDINYYYSSDLSAVIILGSEDCVTRYGELGVDCKDVFICYDYIPLQPYKGVAVHYLKDFNVCGIDFSFADGYSLQVNLNGVSVGICASENVTVDSCDLMVFTDETAVITHKNAICMGKNGGVYSIYNSGDFTYLVKNGRLIPICNTSFQ